MSSASSAGARRGYSSARRQKQAAETRELVVSAATTLFSERGWAGTGMRDIARKAGVSVETVYSNFRSKTELLLTAIDAAVVGDTEPVPLSDRPDFTGLAAGNLDDRIAASTRLVAGINERTWGLHRALGEAAGSEPLLNEKLHDLESRRRRNIREGTTLVLGRPAEDDVLDALWALMGADTFQLLTRLGGRSVEEYERWLGQTIRRLLT